MQCPKCSYEPTITEAQRSPNDCVACGINYSGYARAQERSLASGTPRSVLESRGGFRRSSRGVILGGLAGLFAVLFLGYVAAAPYITVYQIRQAMIDEDYYALEDHVDFPRVRESIKEQLNAAMMVEMNKELQGNPFAAFGMAMGGVMVEKMVATMITPAGLSQLTKGEKPKVGSVGQPRDAGHSPKTKAFPDAEMGYSGFSRFEIEVPSKSGGDPAVFILKRDFINWRLVDIRFPFGS